LVFGVNIGSLVEGGLDRFGVAIADGRPERVPAVVSGIGPGGNQPKDGDGRKQQDLAWGYHVLSILAARSNAAISGLVICNIGSITRRARFLARYPGSCWPNDQGQQLGPRDVQTLGVTLFVPNFSGSRPVAGAEAQQPERLAVTLTPIVFHQQA